jgi:SAM-dependent methyltransferase
MKPGRIADAALSLADPVYRYRWRQRLRLAPPGFQLGLTTWPDRYPEIFAFTRDSLGAQGKHRILSFGCSNGDEVFTLRRYFPNARIRGVDINPGVIAFCNKRLEAAPDPDIGFATAGDTSGEPDEAYDLIFCMAVIREGQLDRRGLERCDKFLDFADYARAIAGFERCLRPGGLLSVRHANFRLHDTPSSLRFETIFRFPVPRFNPIYGPDNRLMPGVEDEDAVFRKA